MWSQEGLTFKATEGQLRRNSKDVYREQILSTFWIFHPPTFVVLLLFESRGHSAFLLYTWDQEYLDLKNVMS